MYNFCKILQKEITIFSRKNIHFAQFFCRGKGEAAVSPGNAHFLLVLQYRTDSPRKASGGTDRVPMAPSGAVIRMSTATESTSCPPHGSPIDSGTEPMAACSCTFRRIGNNTEQALLSVPASRYRAYTDAHAMTCLGLYERKCDRTDFYGSVFPACVSVTDILTR